MSTPFSPTPNDCPPAAGNFAPTRWTLVLKAAGNDRDASLALADLCDAYYTPVFRFIRCRGYNADEARELAHDFFAAQLARGSLSGPDPARGRFRNYLLGAVKFFLCDRFDRTQREKRGGGIFHEPLDFGGEDAPALQIPDPAAAHDDAKFDREWALAVMNRALAALEAEHTGPRRATFEALTPWLTGAGPASYTAAAARLSVSEGAAKVAVSRLRRRFRELMRAEVAQTLGDPAELDGELRHLFHALKACV